MGSRSRFDEAALDAVLATQLNVLSRTQASRCGLSESALRHRLRKGGPWRVLLPGIYVAATGAPSVTQREIGALLYAGPGSTLTGLAALRRYGLRVPTGPAVDVLVPAECRRRDSGFVRLHRTRRMPAGGRTSGALRFVPTARAAADAARGLTEIRDVRAIVAEAVQQGRCLPEMLADELEHGPRQNSALLRQALAEVAAGARSVAEAELKALLKRAHVPDPLFNARLLTGPIFIAKPDCWWPDAGVAVEVDSREWHLSPDGWERTMSRRARMSSYGIIVLHFTPRQIRSEPKLVTDTIKSALQAGKDRPALPIRAVPTL